MVLFLLTKEHQYHWPNSKHKEAKVLILTSNKVDFKTNSMARDKEAYFIMIKGSIYKEGITTINVYIPNNRDSKDMNQKSTELDRRNKFTVIVSYFNNRYFSFMTCIHCGSAISLPLVQRAFSLDSVWWSSICRKYCLSLWQREKRTCTGSETFSRKWFIPSTHISLANAGHREMPTLYSAGLCRPASYRQQVHREKHWT